MAGRKRPRSSSACSTATSKHKVGYNDSWKEDFPFPSMTPRGVLSQVCSVLCVSSTKRNSGTAREHGQRSLADSGLLRRDIIQRHKDSKMHKEAEELEATRLASQKDGGLRQAFSSRVMLQRKALIGALNLMY